MNQVYVPNTRPSSNDPKSLFRYCVRKAIELGLIGKNYSHNQWAGYLFAYEKISSRRTDCMSTVKHEYSQYFNRAEGYKYGFYEEKLKRDFPELFGLKSEDEEEDDSCEGFVLQNMKLVKREIIEQKSPDNIESFKGSDLQRIRKQGNSYVYVVKLVLSEGEEPQIHESDPFFMKVYSKKLLCECIDYDFDKGNLFFTCPQYISEASYCTIQLDATFILEGLAQRLKDIADNGVNVELPYVKFMTDETEELDNVRHKKVPERLYQKLDESQKKAFHAALDKDITFIWGPPGTGKSYTLASVIYTLYALGEDRTAVCCLSNGAVDQLLCKVLDIIKDEGIEMAPGNICRAGRTRDERVLATDYLFPKDEVTQELRKRISRNLERLRFYKERRMEMSETAILLKAENKELRDKLKDRTEFLVKSSSVVFSTISNFVLNDTINNSHFDNLIVDEASMLAMPSLIALGSKISKRLIMVGDFQQLSPIALVKDELLTDSVFEMNHISIRNTKHPGLHQLLNQRRSHEEIVGLINSTFYDDKLIATISSKNEITNTRPYKGKVIALHNVKDSTVRFTKGGTRQNPLFAENVMELLDSFSRDYKAKFSIGIITPYKGEASMLRAMLHERNYSDSFNERIKIGTIHTFQGSECDVIIYDMVDCRYQQNGKTVQIGRLYAGKEGERLINVAVSRARHKLIVICDEDYIRDIPGNSLTGNTRRIFSLIYKHRIVKPQ